MSDRAAKLLLASAVIGGVYLFAGPAGAVLVAIPVTVGMLLSGGPDKHPWEY